ncbi:MAG: phytanoyl-CoA dioxygenase family protein [Pseudomonadota bacterium]
MQNLIAGFYSADACRLEDFEALIAQTLEHSDVPQAVDLKGNIPIYDAPSLVLDDPEKRRAILSEWARVLGEGAGVFILRQAQPDHATIDAATSVFNDIIAKEKLEKGEGADHFAAAGSNNRIWNSLQKLCLADPDLHIRYFDAPAIDAASQAWLGPNYQMTAQVNLVHPGGQAQQPHRDYHLGFQTAEMVATYPAHVHDLSPLMTLQGGLAHVDMTIEAGPTKLLPFSQAYRPGYTAYRRPDFAACFEANCVQLPMQKGDAMFFNPAIFHAAGENKTSDVARMVNLFQVSSAFGRSLETVDRTAMSRAVLVPLQSWFAQVGDTTRLDAIIANTAEGYPFPTNLDTDPPIGGLAPQSQAQLLKDAVVTKIRQADFDAALAEQDAKKQP